ncbi:hypothetical protein JN11_00721 [Mucilaginibacter frigoritolerans]|uniref:Uncharacterized protein n=1 Tax=Mucilaginibacter frigoritolerans TaxID=652788 RepID=A0A562UBM6_9SPHI|nr:hypothetical protein JN11_00721 [Mucilaginibacter frigoritolerans]
MTSANAVTIFVKINELLKAAKRVRDPYPTTTKLLYESRAAFLTSDLW